MISPIARSDDPGPVTAVRITVLLADRDASRCAACGQSADATEVAPVPRQRSRLGQVERASAAGWLLLCGTATTGCRGRVIDEPGWARQNGLTVAADRDPAEVPVWHAVHGLVWLDADGGVYPVPDSAGPGRKDAR
jgi:hypothetical protein